MPSLLFTQALTTDGWKKDVLVEVENGTIARVTADAPPAARAGAAKVAGIALPGVGNLHSHTFQRGFAGLSERRGETEDHFWTWRAEMYRFALALRPEDVEAIAALAFVEMLESGYSAVAEFHYVHHQPDGRSYDDPAELSKRVVAAAAQTGMGLTLLPVFYAHSGFGGAAPSDGQRRFICDLDLFARVHAGGAAAAQALPNGRMGVAPHSLRAVTAEELAALAKVHAEGPFHIHIAEQTKEVEDCVAATGARPVQWLLDHADVNARWCLIHATHMTADETRRSAASGAVTGLCPVTESNLGDGIFPGVAFLGAGGTVGVGTDSNICISLAEELRTLEYSQRLHDRARNRLSEPKRSTGRLLFEEAAKGGAQALGLPIGKIAPGYRADITVLDNNDPTLIERSGDALLDTWIFACRRSPVRDVFIGGEKVVSDGRHHARDAVEANWRKAMRRIAAAT
ncbi:formimidoylglutamate deiminase [Methylovirgula sp. 4M-Z18]|uniref:formimidoylglutamate deiminase n=1 Tax=Methylovirgula sp. 4M-Z18 TaxID=2293567 RepID=UPI000E2F39C5|nr:formimidoylglutamate deiminase [Methylovirgula sp. 4M-Z18]RFB78622.1 formimidoylglutamate deiminase [Methylovirgula sp. 4M-Z18]